jgi:Transposase DDE domain group 1
VLVDTAVAVADGATTISSVAVLAEQAAPTFKRTYGYHPMLAFCDNTGEFLAATLRRGNAGSNTAADHITVLDAALGQVPTRIGTAPRS